MPSFTRRLLIVADKVAPPLGAFPRFLWDEEHPNPTKDEIDKRIKALREAINRYKEVKVVPFRAGQWVKEIEDLTGKYQSDMEAISGDANEATVHDAE
jgi:hypothetical protein